MKPKIYIETSIPSYLTARPSTDIRVMSNQIITADWWQNHRHKYDLYISEFVVLEASQGDSTAVKLRQEAIAELPELQITEAVKALAKVFISEGPIPEKAEIDAFHIAVATVNGMDYLLTWNCTHIANATMRLKIENICRKHQYEPPVICTPQELMED